MSYKIKLNEGDGGFASPDKSQSRCLDLRIDGNQQNAYHLSSRSPLNGVGAASGLGDAMEGVLLSPLPGKVKNHTLVVSPSSQSGRKAGGLAGSQAVRQSVSPTASSAVSQSVSPTASSVRYPYMSTSASVRPVPDHFSKSGRAACLDADMLIEGTKKPAVNSQQPATRSGGDPPKLKKIEMTSHRPSLLSSDQHQHRLTSRSSAMSTQHDDANDKVASFHVLVPKILFSPFARSESEY